MHAFEYSPAFFPEVLFFYKICYTNPLKKISLFNPPLSKNTFILMHPLRLLS